MANFALMLSHEIYIIQYIMTKVKEELRAGEEKEDHSGKTNEINS